jgi:hypothetical protein
MLRATTKRISGSELEQVIAQAPRFRRKWLTDEELDQVCARYTAITGVRVASAAKRRMVATACRTVGPDFLAVVEAHFRRTGTEVNLLAELRGGHELRPGSPTSTTPTDLPATSPRPAAIRPAGRSAGVAGRPGSLDCGCDESVLLPGLIYCTAHQPPFEPTSALRHDRRRSNPGAARFFADERPDLAAIR